MKAIDKVQPIIQFPIRQLGSLLQHVGLTEYVATALDTITDEEVAADVEHVVNGLKLPFKELFSIIKSLIDE